MTINDRVSQLIEILDIKQKDFADKIQLKSNTLSMIKSNKRNITERTINDIIREFGVNKEWLIDGKGEIFNTNIETQNYIDKLVKQYNLSIKDKEILKAYVNMDEDSRNLFYNFIKSISNQS